MLVFLLGGAYYYLYNGTHRNIANEEATVNFQAPELLYQFVQANAGAQAHIDQVIRVSGQVTSIDQKTIVLNNMVQVDLINSVDPMLEKGEVISIKGRCVGYDDLLEVVKIDQATYIPD